MTTRELDVCSTMNCQEKIKVKILSDQDSWNLFKEKAGVAETDELAREVAKECKGLPLAIVTVARALKGKDSHVWKTALRELRTSRPTNIKNVDKDLYSRLELSYSYIESEEAKSCFLFCCLFPEDYNIEIRYLMLYLVGERVFKDVDNLQEAWDTTQTVVDKLKDSCLLLNGDKEGHVKMHDIVRDVAIWIASREEHGFVVKAGVELKVRSEKLEQCKRLSLMRCSNSVLPEQQISPHLQTLLLSHNYALKEVPNNFFQPMKELLVLDLSETYISSLPPSLPCLSSLRTLCLDRCKELHDLSLLKGLVNLEILTLVETKIEELPIEIGDLANLKLLDLTDTRKLKRVPPNVISKLRKLEELYMRDSFGGWEVRGSSGDGSNAGFDEVASLSRLTVLHIHIDDFKCFSLDFPGWENLKKFSIFHMEMKIERFFWFLSDEIDPKFQSACGNYMNVEIISYPICKWVKVLFGRSEGIVLRGVCTNITHLLDDEGRGFNNLKILHLIRCHEMEHITSRSSLLPPLTFQNLQVLTIRFCSRLKNLLPWNLARGLQNLEHLRFYQCDELEVMISVDEEEHELGVLPRLKILELLGLLKLRNVCYSQNGGGGGSHLSLHFPSLEYIGVSGCPNLKRLPIGPQNAPKLVLLRGEEAWFQGLEWEDESVKSHLLPLFRFWEQP
ncbi:putative disease resistance protein At4g27220 isoform X2 [Tasmannia lanceolata]|uniref:putative disease resistance protein At4g27220 isoform X2 n=1 Tax=Tasmannia lanceolata TaxID=3420 RepID=UPI004064155D